MQLLQWLLLVRAKVFATPSVCMQHLGKPQTTYEGCYWLAKSASQPRNGVLEVKLGCKFQH
jgi:hypothetical protein